MASQCDALGLDDLSDSAKAATDAAVAAAALLRALAKVGDVMGILHDDEEELRAELAAANSTIWALTDHHNQTDQTLIRERAELAAAKAERDAFRARHFRFAHLGPRVLRTETAVIAAVALVRAGLGLL